MNEYKKATCCGDDCIYLGNNSNEECWGQVEVVDEEYTEYYSDYWFQVHVCEGHRRDAHEGGKYIPKPVED